VSSRSGTQAGTTDIALVATGSELAAATLSADVNFFGAFAEVLHRRRETRRTGQDQLHNR
jgi:hypothetical protein